MLLAIHLGSIATVLIVIAVILLILMGVLYFLGQRMQKQQAAQQPLIEANTMELSMLIIDKKQMKINEAVAAGLPEQVKEQTPFYLRLSKLPVVKAKVGARMMTLIADPSVYAVLPLKREVKVAVSGLYIRAIKSVRGGVVPEAPRKKGFWAGLRERAAGMTGSGKKKK